MITDVTYTIELKCSSQKQSEKERSKVSVWLRCVCHLYPGNRWKIGQCLSTLHRACRLWITVWPKLRHNSRGYSYRCGEQLRHCLLCIRSKSFGRRKNRKSCVLVLYRFLFFGGFKNGSGWLPDHQRWVQAAARARRPANISFRASSHKVGVVTYWNNYRRNHEKKKKSCRNMHILAKGSVRRDVTDGVQIKTEKLFFEINPSWCHKWYCYLDAFGCVWGSTFLPLLTDNTVLNMHLVWSRISFLAYFAGCCCKQRVE